MSSRRFYIIPHRSTDQTLQKSLEGIRPCRFLEVISRTHPNLMFAEGIASSLCYVKVKKFYTVEFSLTT